MLMGKDVGSGLAADLERHLGARDDSSQVFATVNRIEQDEAQAYPEAALAHLDAWGLHHHYVPVASGGKLDGLETLARLVRTVAGRDLSVAMSHAATFLGSMCVWIGGTSSQQQALAACVLSGERASFALTEKAHDSELLSMETMASAVTGRFSISGEKWLINGAGRNRMVLVFAQTEGYGPRGFSLFLADKRALPKARWAALPKIETLGLRGADLSGIVLDEAPFTIDTMIGGPGTGLETTLKGLQLSRTLYSAMALGAAETGLTTALDHVLERQSRGTAASAQSQRLLTEAWGNILLADGLSGLMLRSLQAHPEQASVHSAVQRFLIPVLIEQAFQRMSTVLGTDALLRREPAAGIFQKMLRDNLQIGQLDGGGMVNLRAVSLQLKALFSDLRSSNECWQQALVVSDRCVPLPDFDWTRLSLSNAGHDVITGSLEHACAVVLPTLQSAGDGATTVIPRGQIARIARERSKLAQAVHGLDVAAHQAGDPAVFEQARIYAVLSAAAAMLIQVATNGDMPRDSAGYQAIITIALGRITAMLGEEPVGLPIALYRDAFSLLAGRRRADRMIGSWPVS